MTDVSRRTVLKVGAGGITVMALGLDLVAAESASATTMPRRSDYTQAVGKVFTAKRHGHTYKLRLKHIEDLTHTTSAQRAHSFNLIFAAVGSGLVPDGIYTLRSRQVRTHTLFLSSVGTHRSMQALVNRTR